MHDTDPIDTILLTWHLWQSDYFPNLSLPHVDMTCRDYRSNNKQWVSALEAAAEIDRRELEARCRQVDLCVDALHWQSRAAIHTRMRNVEAGADVWRMPDRVMPGDGQPWSTLEAYQRAKVEIAPKLHARGLIGDATLAGLDIPESVV